MPRTIDGRGLPSVALATIACLGATRIDAAGSCFDAVRAASLAVCARTHPSRTRSLAAPSWLFGEVFVLPPQACEQKAHCDTATVTAPRRFMAEEYRE